MKDYRIKRYKPEDTPRALINRFDKHFFGNHLKWSDFENSRWFVAYKGGAPWKDAVGYAGLQILDDETVFLCRCGVERPHRGHGLQLQLIRKRTNYAKNRGYAFAYTYTTHDNIYSMRNLISNKFRPCFLPSDWAGTELDVEGDVLYWKKEL
jgi:ribosomal protein S18 acetylase RimI-like enzyme